jgi:ADP-ribose pyrophosphatase YjhB (NUDIX family)
MFSLGAFGLILDDYDRVLLCHRRDYDLWNLPGGGVETGETPWQAVIREIKEETGLEAEIIHFSGVYSKPDKNELVFAFVCRPVGGKISLNDEADRIEYFSLTDIPKNTSPKQIERLKDYLNNKTATVYRIQTGPSSIELIKAGKL